MPNTDYRLRDDHGEVVRIIAQERRPNGLINFEYLLPEHHAGKGGSLCATEFHTRYELLDAPPPGPIVKPLAAGSRDEWRAWALKLEVELAAAKRSYERVCAQDTTGNTW